MNEDHPDFVLRLRPVRDPLGRSPEVRLRQLLKIAGRGLALRCIEARERPTDALPAREADPDNRRSARIARPAGGNRHAAGESRANVGNAVAGRQAIW